MGATGSDGATFFSASIEDGHVLQVDTQTTPHGQRLAGIGLEATSDGAIRVCPEKAHRWFWMLNFEASCDR